MPQQPESEAGAIRTPELQQVCRSLAERSSKPMVAVEGPNHLVRYVNPAFVRLLGKQESDMVGRPLAEALPKGVSEEYAGLINHVFSPLTHAKPLFREPVTKLLELPTQQWSSSMWAIIDADELTVGVMIQLTDLTEAERLLKEAASMNEALLLSALRESELSAELNVSNARLLVEVAERQEAQEALRAAAELLESRVSERTAELESINREVESLAYSMAHDLKTPIRAIVSTSQILREEASVGTFGDEQLALLERQVQGGLRLAAVIDDILAFAHLATAPIKKRPVNVSEMARALLAELAPRYSDRSFTWIIQDDLVVEADAPLIKIAIECLLDNALKFSPIGGTVEFGKQEDGAFFVRDEGLGFSMAYESKLFHPFQRLVREDEYPGSGVGLAKVKRIITRHGGTVGSRSSEGNGSTFSFTLPNTGEAKKT